MEKHRLYGRQDTCRFVTHTIAPVPPACAHGRDCYPSLRMDSTTRRSVPILLRGLLDREALDHAWAEIQRALQGANNQPEILLVMDSEDGDVRPVLEFANKLAALKTPTAAKLYTVAGPPSLIALTAQRRQIVARGAFSLSIGMAGVEACELDETGRLKPEMRQVLKEFVTAFYARMKPGRGITPAEFNKFSAGGTLNFTPAQCAAAGIVEKIIP